MHPRLLTFLMVACFAAGAWLQPATAQDGTNGTEAPTLTALFGECAEELGDQDKMMNYSLYYESFKNKDYTTSLPYLKTMLRCAPTYAGPNRTSDRNLERAIEAYEGLAGGTEDADLKAAYLDTSITLYDVTPVVMAESGQELTDEELATWHIKKGRFIQKNLAAIPDRESDATDAYATAYEINPEGTDAYTVRIILSDLVRRDEKSRAIELIGSAREQYAEDGEMLAYLDQVENVLFPSGEARLDYLVERLEREPDNIEVMIEAIKLAQEVDGRADVLEEIGPRLLQKMESGEAEPSASLYIALGKFYLENGDTDRALEMYESALKLPDAQDNLRDIHYNMGLAYQNNGNLSKARTEFRAALQQDSKFGPALIAIGDLYVSAVSNCATEFDFNDRAVYWLAVDYFQRARSADESVARVANQKISTYRGYYPTQEMLFFRNISAGASHTVNQGCYAWIGESTTVKAP